MFARRTRARFRPSPRKTRSTHDLRIEVSPGIFAISHEAEQQFFFDQVSHMHMLAGSAGVKHRYQLKIKELKKSLKSTAAQVKDIKHLFEGALSDFTNISTPCSEQSGFLNGQEQPRKCAKCAQTVVDSPTPPEEYCRSEETEAYVVQNRETYLQTCLIGMTKQRDDLQLEYDIAVSSSSLFVKERTTYLENLENLESTAAKWQIAIDQTHRREENYRRKPDSLQAELT
jgi:hypothetical protein